MIFCDHELGLDVVWPSPVSKRLELRRPQLNKSVASRRAVAGRLRAEQKDMKSSSFVSRVGMFWDVVWVSPVSKRLKVEGTMWGRKTEVSSLG